MKYVRGGFVAGLTLWTIFCLGGALLALLFNGPETAFLIIWPAFAFMAGLVWLCIEGLVSLYRRAEQRVGPIVYTPGASGSRKHFDAAKDSDAVSESWGAEELTSGAAEQSRMSATDGHDPWAHAPDYEVPEPHTQRRDHDEFPTIKEQFPRL